MTEYTSRISYSCPVADMDAANEFMAWISSGLGDRGTFQPPATEDEDGNPITPATHSLASGVYKPDFFEKLNAPVSEANRPEWGATLDLALAQQGRSIIALAIDETEPTTDTLTATARVSAMTTTLKGVAVGDPLNPPAWDGNFVEMALGQVCTDNNVQYICVIPHTTQSDWPPNAVPNLYNTVDTDPVHWTIGVEYFPGDERTYKADGLQYACLQQNVAIESWNPKDTLDVLWKRV